MEEESEENSELLEHFGEVVPEQSDVGGEVRCVEDEPIHLD